MTITQAGSMTTVQDAGRLGMAHWGMPPSGFMDVPAARMANRLVGNDPDEGLLEVTWSGLGLRTEAACSVAVAGAEFSCTVNGQAVDTNRTIHLQAGDQFRMEHLLVGVRAYVAIGGGLDLPTIGGSVSTLVVAGLGGLAGRALQVGDELPLRQTGLRATRHKPPWLVLKEQTIHVVRAMPGPEVNLFEPAVVSQAFGQPFQLTQDHNRQGFRLQAEPLRYPDQLHLSSSGLVPGSLQVTPDGQGILSMQDGQTTGGYPRMLVVHRDELHKLAQIRPGQDLYFFRSG
nr:biotin-dependent carboxyltransferase family protein [Marinicella sp. NBU2979]